MVASDKFRRMWFVLLATRLSKAIKKAALKINIGVVENIWKFSAKACGAEGKSPDKKWGEDETVQRLTIETLTSDLDQEVCSNLIGALLVCGLPWVVAHVPVGATNLTWSTTAAMRPPAARLRADDVPAQLRADDTVLRNRSKQARRDALQKELREATSRAAERTEWAAKRAAARAAERAADSGRGGLLAGILGPIGAIPFKIVMGWFSIGRR